MSVLKEELVDRSLAQHVAPMTLSVRSARGARVEVPSPKPAVALGVAPIDASMKDFALAVRAFPGQQALARQVIAAAKVRSRELDVATGVRYLPRHTLRPGGSCGHFLITAGTLGGFVEDDDAYYLLSNNHVLANSDLANVTPFSPPVRLTSKVVVSRRSRASRAGPSCRPGVQAVWMRPSRRSTKE